MRKHDAWLRWPVAATVAVAALGCVVLPAQENARIIQEGTIRVATTAYLKANQGRVLGTLVVNDTMLGWAGASGVSEARAQLFQADGTPVSDPVTVNEAGQFVLEQVRDSRPRLFVAVDLKGLQFRASVEAPRNARDYEVLVDAGSTFLADKLRRSALDSEVAFDRLETEKLDNTEDVVNIYIDDTYSKQLLERKSETGKDLNAYMFDRFMEDNPPVKKAVFQLSPGILRGWKPPRPTTQPTPTPETSPTTTPTPTPTPSESIEPV